MFFIKAALKQPVKMKLSWVRSFLATQQVAQARVIAGKLSGYKGPQKIEADSGKITKGILLRFLNIIRTRVC